MSEHRDQLPQENKDELPEHETREEGEGTGGRLVDEAGVDGLPRAEDGEPAIDPDGGSAPPAHR
ncbi:hypothetical protein BH24CHL6_BH24CHL6_12560 [soil metagenome]